MYVDATRPPAAAGEDPAPHGTPGLSIEVLREDPNALEDAIDE